MHELIANIQSNGWAVHFLETDFQTRVGPWLLLDTEERTMEMLCRVEFAPEDFEQMRKTLATYSFCSLRIRMSEPQYADLVAAGIRDPRTAYDKRKAMERR